MLGVVPHIRDDDGEATGGNLHMEALLLHVGEQRIVVGLVGVRVLGGGRGRRWELHAEAAEPDRVSVEISALPSCARGRIPAHARDT
jgi:hypothetical protein